MFLYGCDHQIGAAGVVQSWARGALRPTARCIMMLLVAATLLVVAAGRSSSRAADPPSFAGVWMVDTSACPGFNVSANLSAWGVSPGNEWGDKGCVDNSKYWTSDTSCNLLTFSYGLWPEMGGKHGDLPQTGNLTAHLEHVKLCLESTPKDWDGLGAWDFESWYPIWERNGPPLLPVRDGGGRYQNASRTLVRGRHPTWTAEQIEAAAKKDWETAARGYFEQTLLLCRKLRPRARFGFYNYPAGSLKILDGSCGGTPEGCNGFPAQERALDDRLDWLWAASGALFPANDVCMSGTKGPWGQGNTTAEAMRVANGSIPVYPFIWMKQCSPKPSTRTVCHRL